MTAAVMSALTEIRAYFEARADAEYFTDSAQAHGNEEMRLLAEVDAVIAAWSRLRDFAGHQPLDLMTAKEIHAGLFALAALGEAGQ